MKIDLRSDTLTKPTPAMLEFMMKAEVGDDVYKEDPSVNELERRIADMFGMDSALYFPTGSMTNQAAIKIHTQPGEQLIADAYAHVYNYEGGGVSFNSGVSCKLLSGNRGMITASQVEEAINPPDFYHSPLTTLVCLENTTNKGGGACYNFEEIKRIKNVCDHHGLGFHLDGARLWNAMIAKNENPKDYGQVFDTISVCLSKGLGAPMGSVLVGKQQFMDKAIRVRKILGGGMRQVGYMAAAGIYALDHHLDRMRIDHQRAKALGNVLERMDVVASVEPIDTNIVIFNLSDSPSKQRFIDQLSEKQITISDMGQGKLRIVTHLDYSESHHEHFLMFLQGFR
ncbi:threonine aldolase [Dokdonia pacifica]|uniref:L-threonine aldolase n=1 Tax=Dokdonia pacifica TaxID=1627892 RepID=A0A238YS58_9FLAO|nr:GntG family PLP-dependent aldolase [Dokdonia pacifica]GGG10396.1 threonine aldolase [Dokdonia pacifica]SNR73860.1 L-threonine aldolase [Dokdonia pacifica]